MPSFLTHYLNFFKDTLDIWVNGQKAETAGEFTDEGTETHFTVLNQPAFIRYEPFQNLDGKRFSMMSISVFLFLGLSRAESEGRAFTKSFLSRIQKSLNTTSSSEHFGTQYLTNHNFCQ